MFLVSPALAANSRRSRNLVDPFLDPATPGSEMVAIVTRKPAIWLWSWHTYAIN